MANSLTKLLLDVALQRDHNSLSVMLIISKYGCGIVMAWKRFSHFSFSQCSQHRTGTTGTMVEVLRSDVSI